MTSRQRAWTATVIFYVLWSAGWAGGYVITGRAMFLWIAGTLLGLPVFALLALALYLWIYAGDE